MRIDMQQTKNGCPIFSNIYQEVPVLDTLLHTNYIDPRTSRIHYAATGSDSFFYFYFYF